MTIKNVRMTVAGETFGIALRHVTDVTIRNVTVAPDPKSERLLVAVKDIYGDSVGTQILASDLSGTGTAIQIYGGLIQDNYIHDLRAKSGDHVNGTTSNGSTVPLVIRHNTVLNSYPQTDAVSLFQDFGVEANRVIENNLLGGGGYTVYAGANPGARATSGIRVVNNRFTRIYFPKGGYYGPVAAFDPAGKGNEWSGNFWDDTGEVLPSP